MKVIPKKIRLGALLLMAAFLTFLLPAKSTPEPEISPLFLELAETESDPLLQELIIPGIKAPSEEETDSALGGEQKYAYLTFDDGPSRNTSQILDILDKYGVKGVFFVMGHSINGRNDSQQLLGRMLDEGHYIGLHSMSHQAQTLYYDDRGPANFLEEMSALQQIVNELTGGFMSRLYRAPYGTVGTFTDAHVDAMTASPLHAWDWNVDSCDWKAETVEELLENIRFDLHHRQHSPHAVILFHETDLTIEALPLVIEYLIAEGFEIKAYKPSKHFPINFLDHPDL